MYTKEQLMKYRYFAEVLQTREIDQITDYLTGIIARKYILGFARSLIADNIPFTFVMLDLDNFKFVNDNYGHRAGDGVLAGVSAMLIENLGDFGVAGRFGGDEIMFINFRDIKYDDKKAFFNTIYNNNTLLRRNYRLDDCGCSPFVTGTIGCATFPDDATDYDTLFSMIDKTLYRGKNKGRNCYIIYVAEKHKDIEIKKLAGHSICAVMKAMVRQCEMVPGTDNKFHSILPLLIDELRISDLYYTDRNYKLHSVLDKTVNEVVPDIEKLMKDDIFCSNDITELEDTAPVFCRALMKHGIETALIARICYKNDIYGYLFCGEPRSHRIWQEDECAIMYFLAKLVAAGICSGADALP